MTWRANEKPGPGFFFDKNNKLLPVSQNQLSIDTVHVVRIPNRVQNFLNRFHLDTNLGQNKYFVDQTKFTDFPTLTYTQHNFRIQPSRTRNSQIMSIFESFTSKSGSFSNQAGFFNSGARSCLDPGGVEGFFVAVLIF